MNSTNEMQAESIINLPSTLHPRSVAEFCHSLNTLDRSRNYSLHIPSDVFGEPFGLIVCASVLRQFGRELSISGGSLSCHIPEATRYLAHVGFYQLAGFCYGKQPGAARGNENYIAISKQATSEWDYFRDRESAYQNAKAFSDGLSSFLLRNQHGPALTTVSYIILEICRNVIEHSGADEVIFMGQYYPKRNEVEIAILDEGIGIRRSLRRNPRNAAYVCSDQDAIFRALQRGVTGKPPKSEEEEFRESYDVVWNAGLGLYIVSEICKQQGAFTILSGDTCFNANGTRYNWWPSWFSGTAIQLRLKTNISQQLNEHFSLLGLQGTKAKSVPL